jgi:hypothetical protein
MQTIHILGRACHRGSDPGETISVEPNRPDKIGPSHSSEKQERTRRISRKKLRVAPIPASTPEQRPMRPRQSCVIVGALCERWTYRHCLELPSVHERVVEREPGPGRRDFTEPSGDSTRQRRLEVSITVVDERGLRRVGCSTKRRYHTTQTFRTTLRHRRCDNNAAPPSRRRGFRRNPKRRNTSRRSGLLARKQCPFRTRLAR